MTILDEWRIRLRGLSLMIDPTNGCTFKCPSCPIGNMPKRKAGKMDVSTFIEIVSRVESQVPIKNVLLYSFSEPYLHPRIADMVGYLRSKNIWCMISTNLSRPKNIEATMQAGLNELRISFSGWRLGEYFHKGRDMRQFMSACESVHGFQSQYKTHVALIWHKYKTNADEQPQVEQFARMHHWELIVEPAFMIPYEKHISGNYTPEDLKLIQHLPVDPREEIPGKVKQWCYYQRLQCNIDALGRVFLCRHVWDEAQIVGNILENSVWEILNNMERHSFCIACKERKLNVYTP